MLMMMMMTTVTMATAMIMMVMVMVMVLLLIMMLMMTSLVLYQYAQEDGKSEKSLLNFEAEYAAGDSFNKFAQPRKVLQAEKINTKNHPK